MKKLSLILALMTCIGLTGAIAQKSCAAAKTSCAHAAKSSQVKADNHAKAAATLASMDENIEQRVCEKSGNVSYVRKEKCPASGKVTFTSVEYHADLGKFVNVSPKDAPQSKKACDPAACAKMTKAECAAKCADKKAKSGT